MKTVLITGCSSGYGLETARHFHAQGWNVVATMRSPRADLLPGGERLRVLALDVTRPDSIAAPARNQRHRGNQLTKSTSSSSSASSPSRRTTGAPPSSSSSSCRRGNAIELALSLNL